jgi:hypothetical protein
MAAVLTTSNVSASSMLVVVYLIGALVAAIGAIVAEISLMRTPGPARRIAIGFLSGVVAAAIAGELVNVAAADLGGVADLARTASPIVALVAGGIMLSAVAALGVVVIRSSGADPRSPR